MICDLFYFCFVKKVKKKMADRGSYAPIAIDRIKIWRLLTCNARFHEFWRQREKLSGGIIEKIGRGLFGPFQS